MEILQLLKKNVQNEIPCVALYSSGLWVQEQFELEQVQKEKHSWEPLS